MLDDKPRKALSAAALEAKLKVAPAYPAHSPTEFSADLASALADIRRQLHDLKYPKDAA